MCGIDITIEKLNDNDETSDNNDFLRRRGPHSFQQVILNRNDLDLPAQSKNIDNNFQIRIQSSVLHLRGTQMTAQPVQLQVVSSSEAQSSSSSSSSSLSSSYFCWNGEAYQILMKNQNDDNYDESALNHLQEVSYLEESDTMILGNLLTEVLQQEAMNNESHADPQIPSATAATSILDETNDKDQNDVDDDTEDNQKNVRYETTIPFLSQNTTPLPSSPLNDEKPVTPTLSNSSMLSSVANVFGRVWNGEYAFSLVTPKALYYGKDIWGRRSLLVSSSKDDEKDCNTDDNNNNNSNCWKLTSVSSSTKEQEQQKQQLSELPPGRIYELEFATGIIRSIPIPTFIIPPQLSTSMTTTPIPPPSNVSESMWKASYKLQELLTEAVKRRVAMTPTTTMLRTTNTCSNTANSTTTNTSMKPSKVGLLFSGGLDSVVLSALTSEVLSVSHDEQQEQQPIDLINVAFGNVEQSADRKAAWASFQDLQTLYPKQEWRFVCVNVDWDEVQTWESHIRQLLQPKTTTMDLNIGTALWFASQGYGTCYVTTSPTRTTSSDASIKNTTMDTVGTNESNNEPIHDKQLVTIDNYQSTCLVLLLGMGADEQMAGYGRHRNSFRKNGYSGLQEELKRDLGRLWDRNLGRDDRMVSDHGCEARFPYLDTQVTQFLQHTLDVSEKCNMELEPGVGDKQILRLIAHRLGLQACGTLVKRAIQFGSRMAHLSDKKRFGSRRQATGEAQIRDVQQKPKRQQQ